MNANPYETPVDVQRATYSHKLFWKFAKAMLWCAAAIFACDVILCLQASRMNAVGQCTAIDRTVRELGLPKEVSDWFWEHSGAPRHYTDQ